VPVDFPDEWLSTTVEQLIGPEKLGEIREQEGAKPSLWETVVASRAVSDDQLLEALAARFRMKRADLSQGQRQARELVPEQVARRYQVVPVVVTDSYLEIATANPFDLDAEKTLAFATGREVRVALASPRDIREHIERVYRPESAIDQLLEGMSHAAEITQLDSEPETEDLLVSAEEASQRPVVRMADLILSEGILSRASDIHIEPEEGGVAVRYRIDGVLRQVMKIPRQAGLPLISRFKIMASLDIADRLRPQDGRARVAVNDAGTGGRIPVDLRISTLPASLGEKVVVRILDQTRTVLQLESLGLVPEEAQAIRSLLDYRDGIILVTGPTGSGKTTTLYSAIRYVQSEGVNIVTVEDPVEYRLQGIVQVQVHEKAGLTFASALRSILRQDPDVVLVGEIRDRETAQIAVQASLTGHLVLSTLHTNDAPNAVTRLTDIGMESFKIASALRGVVAQRLLRRLCPECREPLTEPVPAKLQSWIPDDAQLHRAVGCSECAMTGFRGRFSIVEVLQINAEVERAISKNQPAARIAQIARKSGMKSMWDSGLAHVLKGETSIEELLRVVDMPGLDEVESDAAEDRRSTRAAERRAERRLTPAGGAVPSSDHGGTNAGAPRNGDAGGVATIPAGRGALDDFELVDQPTAEPLPGGAKGKVLLIDDEDQLRRVMSDLLERDGFKVIEARDGPEAMEQIDRYGPDIIVLDLNLPGIDGYNLLSQLRSRPATQDIPVVVLTARGDEDNEVRVFELGADDFMSKPFRAKALSARLQVHLSRRRKAK